MLDESRLEDAYKLTALIVSKYGIKYLPIFKRLHEAYQNLKSDSALEKVALHVASEIAE